MWRTERRIKERRGTQGKDEGRREGERAKVEGCEGRLKQSGCSWIE